MVHKGTECYQSSKIDFLDNLFVFFFKMKRYSSRMNWTESPVHKYDSITTVHKQRKHCSVMVRMADNQASDLGSILGQVSNFFVNFIL